MQYAFTREDVEITQEIIDENKESGESDDQVIQYLLNELISEWEQKWCKVIVFHEDDWHRIPKLN